MKKMMLLGALMVSAAAGYAQESRQDVSISGSVNFAPQVNGSSVQKNTSMTGGLLASYRYLLTPRSGLEANYGYAQNTQYYKTYGQIQGGVHTLQQEFSVAYVYGRNFENYNPFAEVGVGAIMFMPLKDTGTTVQIDVKNNTNLGGLFGVGLAYELSPSWDIRTEYRGFVVKTPSFSLPNNSLKTDRYELISTPSIGVAYHF